MKLTFDYASSIRSQSDIADQWLRSIGELKEQVIRSIQVKHAITLEDMRTRMEMRVYPHISGKEEIYLDGVLLGTFETGLDADSLPCVTYKNADPVKESP